MKVVIIGVGQVGRSVAHALAGEHEVIAVDKNTDRLELLRSETDVLTYEGNGARVDVLKSAEVQNADLVIGSTSDDRSNILICSTARALNQGAFTIARVAETDRHLVAVARSVQRRLHGGGRPSHGAQHRRGRGAAHGPAFVCSSSGGRGGSNSSRGRSPPGTVCGRPARS